MAVRLSDAHLRALGLKPRKKREPKRTHADEEPAFPNCRTESRAPFACARCGASTRIWVKHLVTEDVTCGSCHRVR